MKGAEDYESSYQKPNHFIEPPVSDIAVVNENDIKMLLDHPTFAQGTKRQQDFILFGVDFGDVNIE